MPIMRTSLGALNYHTLGAGPPILLLHGFTNFGLAWAPQLPALVGAGFRVVLPDLHGHGASQPATAPRSVEDLANDLFELLDRLEIDRTIVVGLSLGGMLAQRMALDQPRRVAGLVIANSRSSFSGPALAAAVDSWIATFLQDGGPVKRLHATWPLLVNQECLQSSAGRAAFDAWERVLERLPGPSLAHIASGMKQFDLRDRLAAIDVHSLVICGEHDRLFALEDARDIADEIQGAEFAMIPGAGHLSNLDSADRFNRLLLDFLT